MALFNALLVLSFTSLCYAAEGDFNAHTQAEIDMQYKAEQNPDLFEGDIILTPEQQRMIFSGRSKRDAVVSEYRKWPNGVVPYTLNRNFDSRRRQVLQASIQEYNKHTCVRFVPRTNERNYVEFYVGNGCNSMIGRVGRGRQMISIGRGCEYKGTVIHEMMHAIGFWHEQSRLDRDKYITINWGNIQRGLAFAFQKYSHGEADFYGEPYDLKSVMHYNNWAFAVNRRQMTIQSKSDKNLRLGNNYGFTDTDIRQINKMYKCGNVLPSPKPTVNPPNPETNPPTNPPNGCSDLDQSGYCTWWAERGYCIDKKEGDWMKKNCCKSCETTSCEDKHSRCQEWTNRTPSECKKNPRYMMKNCCKSCKAAGH